MEGLLETLNTEQKEAVLYFDSPLLILAGAGSGKTRVITYKIAYMVKELKVRPERILAVTFTNKAAREMKERVEKLVGQEAPVFVATFHSFCVRLLRAHSKRVGYSPNFLILDTDDKRRLLREVIRDLNLDPERYSPSAIASVISNIKNGLYSEESMSVYYDRIKDVLEAYNRRLRENNALDFDDLLIYGRELLKDPELQKRYSNYFAYVLVDEYQDTNNLQYEIVRALSKEKGNICVVGDEDQCIYTWRGANIENILSFERDFPNAKIIKLERNYRCTKTILEAANAVIKNNRLRKGKVLFTDNPKGELIRVFTAETDTEEAKFVASTIKQLIKKGKKPSDIAVFYRTNSQSRVLEDALRREGISYQIVGGVKFYERKEIKDVIAYLRVALFETDTISLFRILNTPRRGLGTAVERELRAILQSEKSNIKALELLKERVSEKQRRAVSDLLSTVENIKEKVHTLPPYDLIKFIVVATGYEEFLRKEHPEDWESRMENVRELGNTLQEFAEREKLTGEGLYLEFLNTITLSSDQDELKEGEKVTLMTVHASKGLEFPIVFITGLEEGLFPHVKSLDTTEEVEEERRLFYVAITRAMELLILSRAKKRRVFGSLKDVKESRFLSEIPSHLVKEVKRKGTVKKESPVAVTLPKKERKPKIVFHQKFGKGVVRRVEGQGENAKVTAFFANYGEKTIVMKFLKILA
ncbi:DNA helicase-2/ATP-dependent DNA helicase PcrA [Phorcysia thermohydrogeniphila]|uniref:DNA 3'-5' helicase n=1 Tax=Phorcysia thermohydrogeniphila TaxID=936138 RepID=A0A4R1GCS7_9BACT|nr:DNA helicase-2/ATP-dependent DNA helicase PcrA [Phorcysia thermohydrogeniphila]